MKKSGNCNLITVFLVGVLILSIGCTKKIVPTRQQFIQQVEELPMPDFSNFKSPQLRANQNPSTGVALSISGGGTRAANFGMGILLGLEELTLSENRNALQEIDYLSTVSGGGFPAGAYISSLFDYYNYGDQSTPYSLKENYNTKIKFDLSRSYVAPMIRAYLSSPRLWFSHLDEGDVLEQAIDNYVLGHINRRLKYNERRSILLGDIFIKKQYKDEPVLLPFHVANGTNFVNMSIIPFTPDVIEQYAITGYTHRVKYCSEEGCIDANDMAYSVGIKASGSFPVAISNTTLKSNFWEKDCYLHILDGGIADNLGYKTAVHILKNDHDVNRKVLMLIDADNTGVIKTFSKKQSPPGTIKMLGRLSYSSLDTRQVVIDQELKEVCQLYDIKPIVFNFELLIQDNCAELPEVFEMEKEARRLVWLLKTDMQNIDERDMQILYELCINVSTKYTIKDYEQELLVLTGRKIVQMQKDKILDLIR